MNTQKHLEEPSFQTISHWIYYDLLRSDYSWTRRKYWGAVIWNDLSLSHRIYYDLLRSESHKHIGKIGSTTICFDPGNTNTQKKLGGAVILGRSLFPFLVFQLCWLVYYERRGFSRTNWFSVGYSNTTTAEARQSVQWLAPDMWPQGLQSGPKQKPLNHSATTVCQDKEKGQFLWFIWAEKKGTH